MASKVQHYSIYLLLIIVGVLIDRVITLQGRINDTDLNAKVQFTEITRSRAGEKQTPSKPSVIKQVADRVTPSVVLIETTFIPGRRQMPEDGKHDFEDKFWDRIMPGRRMQSSGSGVIISKEGYILTNHHVIKGALKNEVEVELLNRKRLPARVVGADPSTDLAVIKVEAEDLPAAVLGDDTELAVGDWVVAIGNPFRLKSTVTAGIVSAKGREVEIIQERLRVEHFIQTDAAINRGNSGGALVNLSGEVVGINTAIASESGGYEGYGFAIPINLAIKVATDIIEFGEVQRGLLGVTISSIDYERAQNVGLEQASGVEILSLIANGAAEKAGLKIGDIILAIDDRFVEQANDLQAIVALYRPGQEINLHLWRDKSLVSRKVELMGTDSEVAQNWINPSQSQERIQVPEEPSIPSFHFKAFGLEVMELVQAGSMESRVLVITKIEEGSPAFKSGFSEGDQIISINGHDAELLSELKKSFLEAEGSGHTLTLEVEKNSGAKAFYTLGMVD